MTELLQWLHKGPEQIPGHISLLHEPAHYSGLTVKSYIRFVYFEHNSKEKQYIGFNDYKIEADMLYLIPPCELYFLPHTVTGFRSICIPLHTLNARKKQVLFSLYYKDTRDFKLKDEHLKILKSYSGGVFPGIVFEILKEHTCITDNNASYLAYAEAFHQLLSGMVITHGITIRHIAQTLGVTYKTLERACSDTFNTLPKHILRYHLLSKCIFMLLHNREELIANIAGQLGFNELSAFNRFIKSLTDSTPNEIRTIYTHIDL